MPTGVKNLDNMSKHLTQEEIQARLQAEADYQPTRTPDPPAGFNKKTAERRIWDRVISDMEGYKILDRLDADVLEIYCRQQVRLRMLQNMLDRMINGEDGKLTSKAFLDLLTKIKDLEGTILNYAGRLGLTPESRARLAKNAAQPDPDEEDGDLFG